MTVRILEGDCLEVMSSIDAESVDAIITDPPYHLTTGKKGGFGVASLNPDSPAGRSRVTTGFMGKAWDGGDVAFRVETWTEVLRVAKPGAHLLAFGGTRTVHRLTCAIEDAGWEIRDCLSWLYGSGFPKSRDVGGGRGTALKPAWEPIMMARKPLIGPVAANLERHGTGALNVDACRLEVNDGDYARNASGDRGHSENRTRSMDFGMTAGGAHEKGRWPANVCLDETAAAMLDEQTGDLTSGANPTKRGSPKFRTTYGTFNGQEVCLPARGAETGGASRFYYVAKAGRAERNAGLEGEPEKPLNWSVGPQNPGSFQSPNTHRASANHHPTVKPLALMRWLVRLVAPPSGLILDPFMGSGTTGIAATLEGFNFIGIEQEPEYCEISHKRIAHYEANHSLELDLT